MAGKAGRSGRKEGSLGDRAKLCHEVYEQLALEGKIDDAAVQVKLYKLACAGEVNAIREYNDRRFGRPPQSLHIPGIEQAFLIAPQMLSLAEWQTMGPGFTPPTGEKVN